jgi:hypothetical protein
MLHMVPEMSDEMVMPFVAGVTAMLEPASTLKLNVLALGKILFTEAMRNGKHDELSGDEHESPEMLALSVS